MSEDVKANSAARLCYSLPPGKAGPPNPLAAVQDLWRVAHLAETTPGMRRLLLGVAGELSRLTITDDEARAIKTATVYLQPQDDLPGIAEDKAILLELIKRLWL